ncbi:MAG: hypothetical protein DI535_24765 [Citrobacter freundii]|nr:MAG: hypothetical protein DI535_24765 [Citrobacter freundii]
MIKWILLPVIFCSCNTESTEHEKTVAESSNLDDTSTPIEAILLKADSVVLVSHYSPNEPRKDTVTGKWINPVEVIKDGAVNEKTIVERKTIKTKDIKELIRILNSPAIEPDKYASCFQPRHAIFAYSAGSFSFLDICFDCRGASQSNDIKRIIFDNDKYIKLADFFVDMGFTYMLTD